LDLRRRLTYSPEIDNEMPAYLNGVERKRANRGLLQRVLCYNGVAFVSLLCRILEEVTQKRHKSDTSVTLVFLKFDDFPSFLLTPLPATA
jgi:hypothetical protein